MISLPVMLAVSAIDIPTRLRFLEGLAERPAFEGDARLQAIIADYRRTKAALDAAEEAAEEVDP